MVRAKPVLSEAEGTQRTPSSEQPENHLLCALASWRDAHGRNSLPLLDAPGRTCHSKISALVVIINVPGIIHSTRATERKYG
mgnify:CR=1 FL=1